MITHYKDLRPGDLIYWPDQNLFDLLIKREVFAEHLALRGFYLT